MTTNLTRRDLLIAMPASLGFAAVGWPASPLTPAGNALPHWLIPEMARVIFELRLFSVQLVPLLLRRPRVPGRWSRGLVAADPAAVQAYRGAAQGLSEGLVSPPPVAKLNRNRPPLADVLPFMHAPAQAAFLQEQIVDRAFVGRRCSLVGDRLVWSCPQHFAGVDPDLPSAARRILAFVQPLGGVDDPVAALQALPPPRLLEAVRRMPFGECYLLIDPLFRFVPKAPAKILSVVLNKLRCWSKSGQPGESGDTNFQRSVASYLLCTAMGALASNHFCRIPRLARLPEIAGDWLGFMPGQILDVLYQKVLVLQFLKEEVGYD